MQPINYEKAPLKLSFNNKNEFKFIYIFQQSSAWMKIASKIYANDDAYDKKGHLESNCIDR